MNSCQLEKLCGQRGHTDIGLWSPQTRQSYWFFIAWHSPLWDLCGLFLQTSKITGSAKVDEESVVWSQCHPFFKVIIIQTHTPSAALVAWWIRGYCTVALSPHSRRVPGFKPDIVHLGFLCTFSCPPLHQNMCLGGPITAYSRTLEFSRL